jgi:hypothetical protein
MGWGAGFGDALTAFAQSQERAREFKLRAMDQAMRQQGLDRQQQLAEETQRHNQATEAAYQKNIERQQRGSDLAAQVSLVNNAPGVELTPEAYAGLFPEVQAFGVKQQTMGKVLDPLTGSLVERALAPGVGTDPETGPTRPAYMTNSRFDITAALRQAEIDAKTQRDQDQIQAGQARLAETTRNNDLLAGARDRMADLRAQQIQAQYDHYKELVRLSEGNLQTKREAEALKQDLADQAAAYASVYRPPASDISMLNMDEKQKDALYIQRLQQRRSQRGMQITQGVPTPGGPATGVAVPSHAPGSSGAVVPRPPVGTYDPATGQIIYK